MFLRLLGNYATRYELEIWGYCLIAAPQRPDSAALCSRPHPSRLRPLHQPCSATLRGISGNPVRAALSQTADRFPWSSAPFRLGHAAPPAWLNLSEWSRQWNAGDWTGLLQESTGEPAFGEKFRTN